MPVAGLDSSRAGVESGVAGPSLQILILSQYADKIFNDLSVLIDSFDSRISALASIVASDPVKGNTKFKEQRNAIGVPYDRHRALVKSDIASLLNPESRDER